MWCIRSYHSLSALVSGNDAVRGTYHVQLAGEEGRTAVLRLALVCGVALEKVALVHQRSRDGLVGVDIALTTVDHWDVAQAQGDNPSSKNVNDIGAGIPICPSVSALWAMWYGRT